MSSPALLDFYAPESAKIRQTFENIGDGRAAARERSGLVDRVVTQLHQDSLGAELRGPEAFCLVAVGGYGRQELFPHSDVDLLFLSANSRAQTSYREPTAAISRALWDIGLRVGSGPRRTLSECYELYRDNLEFTVSLFDCRYITGDRQVFTHLRDRVIPHVVARDRQDLVRNLVEITRRRHEKYGSTIFHLEPNLKDAPGGLRDYHVARWLSLISELEERGRWITPDEMWPGVLRVASRRAFEFLSAARCFLHYQLERDDNLLTYGLQEQAASLGIGWGSLNTAGEGLHAAEWMREYFRHVRSIDRLTTQLIDVAMPSRSSLYGLFQDWKSRLSNADFSVVRGRIFPRQPAATVEDASLLLSVFEMVARHHLELSREAERWVEDALPRVAQHAPCLPVLWRHFQQILVLPNAAGALRAMHRLGLLVTLFPEFRAIDALVVRDFYHRYTVDEHSLMTIQNLHALRTAPGRSASGLSREVGEEWEGKFSEILEELEQPELLFFSLLFHDVGKGTPGVDHIRGSLEAIEAIFTRLGLDPEARETVRFLIFNHLEMSATLLRRDIFDPETIRAFTKKIVTPEHLKMLCLLTYADIKAVNPEALTPWKAEMLWQLYVAASNDLSRSLDEDRLHVAEGGMSKAEHILPLLRSRANAQDLNAFLEGFPKRYLETHAPEEIAAHFQMARQLSENPVQINLRSREHCYELTVVTPDRPFLFASLTGALAAWGMNILKADAFANGAGIVLDTFRFVDLFRTLKLNPSEVARFEKSVVEVLTGEVSLQALMSGRVNPQKLPRAKVEIPTHVRFDNTSSSHSTLLEVITQDRPGLLYQVSSRLAELGCNIEVALIDTEGQKVIDVFYLTSEGAKLIPREQDAVLRALLQRLSET